MRRVFWTALFLLGTVAACAEPFGPKMFWEIGRKDGKNADLALAPGGFAAFRDDGVFFVGDSDSARDWPYIHPGPADLWAGGRQHSFTVVFGVKSAVAEGQCRLLIDLLDTHWARPPKLRIEINDFSAAKTLPVGGGDDSAARGDLAKGKPFSLAIDFPASKLKAGENVVRITTVAGSWMLYDRVGLETPHGVGFAPVESRTIVKQVRAARAIAMVDGRERQPILLEVHHLAMPCKGLVKIGGAAPQEVSLARGVQEINLGLDPFKEEKNVEVALEVGGKAVGSRTVAMMPVRRMTVYLLPHSHVDIGYTESQAAVEAKQVKNEVDALAHIAKTAKYPPGAQFKWNLEVLWPAECFLTRRTNVEQAVLCDAVRRGTIGLNGMYLNELTGLCRPEELLRLFRYSTQLGERCGVKVDSAMISDVPGYTWGTVTAMSQAGIKYFSAAPNFFDRIGDILVKWENKPFYWVSPSGRERVLVWIPQKGYALSHIIKKMTPRYVDEYQAELDKTKYPYEIAYLRWSGHGDNAVPEPSICEFVKDWQAKYAWPKFVIATTSEAFSAFEKRYGKDLPEVRGDWTPYWEDGAGSSAAETAMNRASSDRLVQAETLIAMLNPSQYPVEKFTAAWRNLLLYSEHTWGAHCSVSDPENSMTVEQWGVKQSYARNANKESTRLFYDAASLVEESPKRSQIDVWNTSSWPRSDLMLTMKAYFPTDRVVDDAGKPVPSQRLKNGDLVFWAADVPAFGARRYRFEPGAAHPPALPCKIDGHSIGNGRVEAVIHPKSGAIVRLAAPGISENLVDNAAGHAMNEYLYLPGDNLADLKTNGPVKVSVKESGPLVAVLEIVSEAPGCKQLTREIWAIAGTDFLMVSNRVDKIRPPKPADAPKNFYKTKAGKESVNFAFPFRVPGGQMRLELPLAVIRPDKDLMPSACKNWFTVGRWADVSNAEHGITWVTLDAPLVQVGGLTATLLESQSNPDVWRKTVEPTTTLYSWAMNNHWGTNYRAYQEGPVEFRFVLRPHKKYDAAEATRFATGISQPLLPDIANGEKLPPPRLKVEPADVIVIAMKPADDGKGTILRLYGASGETKKAKVTFADGGPTKLFISDLSEKPKNPAPAEIEVPGFGVVTLRAE